MLRFLQRGTIILFLLVAAGYAGLTIHTHMNVDRTPPVITCDSDVVEIRVGSSDSALLRGVTATDDQDGDVTDEIMIKGVSQLITANTARVTYIAFDSSNNMSTATRTVRYTNYEKPRFALQQPLRFASGGQIALLDRLTASDVIDGDISKNILVTTQNVNANQPGTYTVTVQVVNRLGDVEFLPLKVIVANHAESAVQLSDYIVYLDAGSIFDPRACIIAPTDPFGVKIDSNVETNTPGIYDVTYTYQTDTVCQTVVVR